MIKNIGKNIIKNLRSKYSQKLCNQTSQSATDAFKTASKKEIQKAAETTGDLICNKIANRITKVSKNYKQNNSETVTNEHNHNHKKRKYSLEGGLGRVLFVAGLEFHKILVPSLPQHISNVNTECAGTVFFLCDQQHRILTHLNFIILVLICF